MATGKTHSRHFRLLLDEYDISGDARTVGNFGAQYSEEDVTGWSNGVVNYTLGQLRAFIEGFQAVFDNTALLGSHVILATRKEYIASMMVGIRAAPVAGDIAFALPLEQKQYVVDGQGPALISVDLIGPGQGHTVPSKAWGVVLDPGTSRSVTFSGTSVNDVAAATTNGGKAYLHVLAKDAEAGTYALIIEHSTDGNSWATLGTFTLTGSALDAEQLVIAAGTTVNKWLRFSGAKTGTRVATFACTFVRE